MVEKLRQVVVCGRLLVEKAVLHTLVFEEYDMTGACLRATNDRSFLQCATYEVRLS